VCVRERELDGDKGWRADLGNGVHDVVDHHELGVPELVLQVDAQRLHSLRRRVLLWV